MSRTKKGRKGPGFEFWSKKASATGTVGGSNGGKRHPPTYKQIASRNLRRGIRQELRTDADAARERLH